MSTSKATIAYLLEQLEPLDVRAKAMFGEYGIYASGKLVMLVCDETVFLKPTPASAGLEMAPPYPGAKHQAVVPAEITADADAFRALVAATADALPAPKPKVKKSPR